MTLKLFAFMFGFPAFAAEAPLCITATDLSAQIAHDKKASDLKFKGKALVITGKVNYVGANPRVVDLKTDASFLIRASGVDFSSLRPNQLVTLKCVGDGTLAPITVSSCTIVPANSPCMVETKTVPTTGPNVVHITLSPTITGDTITIAGTTDLRDGAVLSWDVEHAQQKKNLMADLSEHGDTAVKGGKYAATVKVGKWPKGNITVWIGFFSFLKSQPQWARTQYGTQGERLEGTNVKLQSEGMKTIEIERIITKQ